jgi:hypothetical protein
MSLTLDFYGLIAFVQDGKDPGIYRAHMPTHDHSASLMCLVDGVVDLGKTTWKPDFQNFLPPQFVNGKIVLYEIAIWDLKGLRIEVERGSRGGATWADRTDAIDFKHWHPNGLHKDVSAKRPLVELQTGNAQLIPGGCLSLSRGGAALATYKYRGVRWTDLGLTLSSSKGIIAFKEGAPGQPEPTHLASIANTAGEGDRRMALSHFRMYYYDFTPDAGDPRMEIADCVARAAETYDCVIPVPTS